MHPSGNNGAHGNSQLNLEEEEKFVEGLILCLNDFISYGQLYELIWRSRKRQKRYLILFLYEQYSIVEPSKRRKTGIRQGSRFDLDQIKGKYVI